MNTLFTCRFKHTILLSIGLVLFLHSFLYSQNNIYRDSLIAELDFATNDSSKIKLYFQLASHKDYQNPRRSNAYVHRILELASKDADLYIDEIIMAYNTLSGNCIRLAMVDSSFFYSQKALELADEYHKKAAKPNLLNNLALAYSIKGDWHEAIKYYNEGLDIIDELGQSVDVTANICNNLGVIFMDQNEYHQAHKYFNIAFDVSSDLKDSLGISIALTNIGEVHYFLGNMSKALSCYNEALNLSEAIKDDFGIGYLLNNIATVHFDNKNIKEAEKCLAKSIKIAQRLKDNEGMIRIYFTLAKIAQYKHLYNQSIQYCNSGLLLAREMKSKKYIRDYYELLSENYELKGSPRIALNYFQLFKSVNDSLFNEEKNRKLAELSIQYETRKKETENELLKEEQAKNQALIRSKTTLSVAAILAFILVSLIAFILFWKNQLKLKYNKRLEELVDEKISDLKATNEYLERSNKELEQFAYVCSHDLKEPLRNIHGFTGLLNRSLGDDQDATTQEYIGLVQNNIRQMYELIEGILEYSRVGYDKKNIEETDLNQVVNNLRSLLQSSIEERNVSLKIAKLPIIKSNGGLVLLILKNLVENAIKYNQSTEPVIEISSSVIADKYHIEVKDNGIGIEKEYSKQIFTIFKRLHTRKRYKGAGIGLSICEKIVKNLGGDIWVESEFGKGSRFIFTLPVNTHSSLKSTRQFKKSVLRKIKKPFVTGLN